MGLLEEKIREVTHVVFVQSVGGNVTTNIGIYERLEKAKVANNCNNY